MSAGLAANHQMSFTVGGIPGTARLRFDGALPIEVQITFLVSGDETEWVISRDLLIAGVNATEPRGIGDVRVCREGDSYLIGLASPEGQATACFDWHQLRDWLELTDLLMPSHGPSEDEALAALVEAALAEIFRASSC